MRKKCIQRCHQRIQIANTRYFYLIYIMPDKITAKDLADKKGDFVLIDVREADEVAEDGGATIEGAVNIPLGQLIRKTRQGGLDDLKGKTICTYCNGGTGAISLLMNLTRKGLQV